MRFSCVGGGSAGPACPLCTGTASCSFETPKRRCAPALRFPTSISRPRLQRFAHPSDVLMKWELCWQFNSNPVKNAPPPWPGPGHLAAWGPGPGGLGRPRWPAKKITKNISSDTGNLKKWQVVFGCSCSSFTIEDFVPAIRSLKPPCEMIPVVHLWASPGVTGRWRGRGAGY
eukprot:gene7859-biopygen3083